MRQEWLRRLDATRPEGTSPLGWRCFQLGLLLLASSALLAGVLLLVALILGCRQRLPWWRDRVNQVLLLVSALMVLGCFTASSGWLAWVGLGNWLPFFWAFWGFQPYLASAPARRRLALWLVAGTVPVIVTGLGQIVWGWSGPFQTLGGAIIWHLNAGGNPPGRLAGLFDYANIAGAWLALAWPFALAALLQRPQPWPKRLPALLITVGLVAAIALTDSRNAWGALVLALPLVAGPARWIWLLPLLLLLLIPVGLASLPGVPLVLQQPARALVPAVIWERLSDLEFAGRRPLAITRVSQWGVALQLVAERPWLGWGAAAFSVIYPLRTAGIWHGHPHNLPIDLAVSHGALVAVLLVGLVLALQIQAARRGMASGALFDRAWWAAFLVLMALHATDIPLYDSRINIAGWVLLCGLRAYSLSPEPRRRF
ncbi:O-antigen ligase family protein [Synechococcus sp. Cruz-9H2]|uniref:O-antigen ligase family protein n=1 Tax=unclassified Synechococcus TaxID=2626047 RepID=UPI0020CB7BC2|nr:MULTISPECIES: O-antigen ligase family protein [unclassified Synechococcus]MCP9819570.1 O-antigen ligase family protein [Synechococcus sp. Cruz-9H2]MCP9843874.1 O-antigen ligase family protein [Synechococcus sp. Edmonson 11F2]MCP9855768.1 O-antigen ligase family protein [Synechococcus sp. Cruz-9C9]MCP9863284.1 O-antigen ligase family protein [Synechococcus sp. Cruz-7E5]MCP9870403.1 O-antigen ligase family protein [Synechococcus sp. Cruz-7B9]